MVMGSLFGEAAVSQSDQGYDPNYDEQNPGDIPYAQGDYQKYTPPQSYLNPNQAGFRDPVYNPGNISPGDPYAPNPDYGIVTPWHPINEAASPYLQAAQSFVGNATQAGFQAQNLVGAAGSYGQGYNPEVSGAVGQMVGQSLVPQSVEEFLLNVAMAPKGASVLERLTGLPFTEIAPRGRAAAEELWRAGQPERSLYPGLSGGPPPTGSIFDPFGDPPLSAYGGQAEDAINLQRAQMGPEGRIQSQAEQQAAEIDQLAQQHLDDLRLQNPVETLSQPVPEVRSTDYLKTAPDVVSSPETMFHGTGQRFDAFDEGLLDQTALFGPGVYLTDSEKIADSYAVNRGRKTGEEGVTNEVTVRPDTRLINLEQPLPADVQARILAEAERGVGFDAEAWDEAAKAIRNGDPGKGVYSAFKEGLAYGGMTSTSDAGEAMDGLNQVLKEAGYDGLAHVGGIKGGGDHNVTILFDPKDVVEMHPRVKEAAAARTAEDTARQNYLKGPDATSLPAPSATGEVSGPGFTMRPGETPSTQEGQELLAQLQTESAKTLSPEEIAAVTRRLEAPAYSIEGQAERAGIGQAPTRQQAIEDAQQELAGRTQAQAERFEQGNGRPMTPTEFARMAEAERVASGIKPEQVRSGILDWLNLPRSLMTGMDLSFALRQMILLAPSHPIEWAKSVGTGIKSAFSEDYAAQVAKRIAESPYAEVHGNLYIAPSAKGVGTISEREEQYATALLDRIPGLGAIYRPFERGNTAMINQFRSDVADNFVKNTLSLKGETLATLSPETRRQIGIYDNFINRGTGRGTLGGLDKTIVPLGQVFFSLRNTIAKPQALATLASKPFTPAWNQAAKDMAGFLGLGATTLYLAKSAGLDVGVDPRSSDFGKIKAGDQRIDIWGGWQQQARAIFQTVQGVRGEQNSVTASGRGSVKSPLEIALPWVGNRMSPQAGLAGQGARAVLENKTDDGPMLGVLQQMFPDYRAPGMNASTALNYMTPLWWQDVADAIKYEGVAGGLRTAPLTFFGVGSQTYESNANPRSIATNQVMENSKNLSSLPPNVQAFLQDKSWNAATPKEQRAIMATLSPDDQAKVKDAEQQLRDQKDIFQLSRDESTKKYELAGQQREALKPIADKLLEQWKAGTIPPDKAIEAMKRVEAAADKESGFITSVGPKLSESQGYQDKLKSFDGDKTAEQKEVDRIREVISKYHSIYDDPRVTRPDGTKDWDRIQAAQTAVMDALKKADPGFATRVEFNLQKDPNNDFEFTKWINKIDDRLDKAGYFAAPAGSKTEFARSHPDVDALLSLKYGNPVHSQQAGNILLSLAPERKVVYAK